MASGWESIERQPDTGATPADQKDATDFLYGISCMLDDRRFRFATDTLEGIYENVEKALRVTPGQRKAVNNIRRSMKWDDI